MINQLISPDFWGKEICRILKAEMPPPAEMIGIRVIISGHYVLNEDSPDEMSDKYIRPAINKAVPFKWSGADVELSRGQITPQVSQAVITSDNYAVSVIKAADASIELIA